MASLYQDHVTLPQIIKKLPKVIKKLPKMTLGLRYVYAKRTDKHTGLGLAFAKAVKAHPNATAVKYEDMQISYRQLDEWSNQLANYLISQGYKKGDVFALALENRPEMLCGLLAAAKTGMIAALINTSQSGKVLKHSIDLVNPKLIIVGNELVDTLTDIKDQLNLSDSQYLWWDDIDTYHHQHDQNPVPIGMTSLAALLHTQPKTCPNSSKDIYLNDGLFYIFTSGTTGLPKAVVFNHGRWMKAYGGFGYALALTPKDTLYVALPLYHATASVICWSCAVAGGSAIALQRKFSVSKFWHDVHKFNATSFGYVGELCRYLIDTPVSDLEHDNPITKMVGNGLRPSIWYAFKERFGIEEVMEFYASSEGNVGFTNLFNLENTVGFTPLPFILVEFDRESGAPVRNDDGFMTEVAQGETGLLLGEITDNSPFDGYTDPEKTRAKVFTDVLTKGDRYFNTGDLMRHIGFKHCQFVDRVGDTFRWKGENVSTTEVENIIADCDGVGEAIVYGVEIAGTDGRAGMAAITLDEGVVFDEAYQIKLLQQITQHLPSYALPVFIRILDNIETTSTFKYKKSQLKEVGFDPSQTSDSLWVRLPKSECWSPVTDEIYVQIQNSGFRF